MMRELTIFLFLITLFSNCKNKYKAAFEEIDKREGYMYPIEGDMDEIILLTDAIKYKPELYELYYRRAVHYQLLGEYEKALKDYQICVVRQVSNTTLYQLYLDKGICESRLDQWELALQDLKHAQQHFEEYINTPIKVGIGQPKNELRERIRFNNHIYYKR
jgi:tetratricopeptide (TPR) repeat protein